MLFESTLIKPDQTLISEITQIEEAIVLNILITKLDMLNINKLNTHSTQLKTRASLTIKLRDECLNLVAKVE